MCVGSHRMQARSIEELMHKALATPQGCTQLQAADVGERHSARTSVPCARR